MTTLKKKLGLEFFAAPLQETRVHAYSQPGLRSFNNLVFPWTSPTIINIQWYVMHGLCNRFLGLHCYNDCSWVSQLRCCFGPLFSLLWPLLKTPSLSITKIFDSYYRLTTCLYNDIALELGRVHFHFCDESGIFCLFSAMGPKSHPDLTGRTWRTTEEETRIPLQWHEHKQTLIPYTRKEKGGPIIRLIYLSIQSRASKSPDDFSQQSESSRRPYPVTRQIPVMPAAKWATSKVSKVVKGLIILAWWPKVIY